MANELDSFTPDWMDGKGLRGDNQDSLPDPMGPATGLPEENVFEVTTPIDDTPGNTDPGPGGGGGIPDLNVYNNTGTLVYTGADSLTIYGKTMRWQEVEWCDAGTTKYRLVLTCAPYTTSIT